LFELFLAKEIDVKTALKMLKLTPDLVKALMDQVNIPIRQLKQSSNLQRNLILCQCQESLEDQLCFLADQARHLVEQVADLEEQVEILTDQVEDPDNSLEEQLQFQTILITFLVDPPDILTDQHIILAELLDITNLVDLDLIQIDQELRLRIQIGLHLFQGQRVVNNAQKSQMLANSLPEDPVKILEV
jgi:hypothetical protein